MSKAPGGEGSGEGSGERSGEGSAEAAARLAEARPIERRNGLSYADAGVSIDAGDALVEAIKPLAAATARAGVLGGLGGFGGLFDLQAAGWTDPVLVAATDGVGTKLKLGIETDQLEGLGVDLVAMCVNDLICQGAEPLFFLDYFATGRLEPERGARLVSGIAAACQEAGCALIGGETAEMPGLYAPGDFDLAGFAVGAAARDSLLPRPCRAGDQLLGSPSAGAHANGFSLIRKIIADAGLDWAAPAPFAPDRALGAVFATPTRLYVRQALELLRDPAIGHALRGVVHVTGGGLTENLPRALGPGLRARINLGAWRAPAEFLWLAGQGGVSEAEMLRTFNCGVGLAVIVAPEAADAAAARLRAGGDEIVALGEVIAADDAEAAPDVVYDGALIR